MKRAILATLAACLTLLAACGAYVAARGGHAGVETIKVGFIYENDESSPYTYGFSLTQQAVEKAFADRVKVYSCSNVHEDETKEPIRTLVHDGCGLIFAVTRSDQVVEMAAEYPGVTFCQVSHAPTEGRATPENYHTFNAAMYQAHYLSGLAAGLKLRELQDRNRITSEEALAGFVGQAANAETISAFTAFLLGARMSAPTACLVVSYSGASCGYSRDVACAEALIAAGCRVIGQNTHTIGPAEVCERTPEAQKVYHVSCDWNLLDIAPSASLACLRANWTPYVTGAVKALLDGVHIESAVSGSSRERDMWAGFERGWLELMEVNRDIAAIGTRARMENAVEQLRKKRLEVFRGNYTGARSGDPAATVDLGRGWPENSQSSYPGFDYILDGLVTVLDDVR